MPSEGSKLIKECIDALTQPPTAHATKILLSEELTDLILVVDSVHFHVHSMILCLHSPVFHAQLLDSLEDNEDVVTVSQPFLSETFAQLLVFIYLRRACINNVHDGLHLWEVANYYEVTDLMEFCKKYIQDEIGLNTETAVAVLRVAVRHPNIGLQGQCIELLSRAINRTNNSFLGKPEFLELAADHVLKLVKMQDIDATECQIFVAVCKWAKAQQKTEAPPSSSSPYALVQQFIPYIKFGNMSLEELTRVVQPSKVVPIERLYEAVLSVAEKMKVDVDNLSKQYDHRLLQTHTKTRKELAL